jgi:hypothetical protein
MREFKIGPVKYSRVFTDHPSGTTKGHHFDGICWFVTLFSLATSLSRVSTALMLMPTISAWEADAGLVLHVAVDHLLGEAASVLILTMLFVATVSTGPAMRS